MQVCLGDLAVDPRHRRAASTLDDASLPELLLRLREEMVWMLGLGNTSMSSVEVVLQSRSAMTAEDALAVRRAAGVPDPTTAGSSTSSSGTKRSSLQSSAADALCSGAARTAIVRAYGPSSVSSCVCAHVIFRPGAMAVASAASVSESSFGRADESPWYLAATLSGMLGQSAGVSTALTGLVSVTSSAVLPVYQCGAGRSSSIQRGLSDATLALLRAVLPEAAGLRYAGSESTLVPCGEGVAASVVGLVWPWLVAVVVWIGVVWWYMWVHGSVQAYRESSERVAGGSGPMSRMGVVVSGGSVSTDDVTVSRIEALSVFHRAGRFSPASGAAGLRGGQTRVTLGTSSSMQASGGSVRTSRTALGSGPDDDVTEAPAEVVRAGILRMPAEDGSGDSDGDEAYPESVLALGVRRGSDVAAGRRGSVAGDDGSGTVAAGHARTAVSCGWRPELLDVLALVSSWAVLATQVSVAAGLGFRSDGGGGALGAALLATAVGPVACRACVLLCCARGCSTRCCGWRERGADAAPPEAGGGAAGVVQLNGVSGRVRGGGAGGGSMVSFDGLGVAGPPRQRADIRPVRPARGAAGRASGARAAPRPAACSWQPWRATLRWGRCRRQRRCGPRGSGGPTERRCRWRGCRRWGTCLRCTRC